jgi:hypothetical protein
VDAGRHQHWSRQSALQFRAMALDAPYVFGHSPDWCASNGEARMLSRSLLAAGLLGAATLSIASVALLYPSPSRGADNGLTALAEVRGFYTPPPGSLRFKGAGSDRGPALRGLSLPPGSYRFKGAGSDPGPALRGLSLPPGSYRFKGAGSDPGPALRGLPLPPGGYQFKGGGSSKRWSGGTHGPVLGHCRPISTVFFENCWWRRMRCRGPGVPAFCLSCPDLPGGRCPRGT